MDVLLEAARAITKDSAWAAAFVVASTLLVFAVLKWIDEVKTRIATERHCAEIQAALQEKRLTEKESALTSLNAANLTSAKMADALSANTAALDGLKGLTLELAKDIGFNDEHWKQRAPRWEEAHARIEACLKEVRTIVSETQAKTSHEPRRTR